MVQLSHSYMTTGKTIDMTIQTFVGKVMSLLSNMLSRFVIALLPKSKHLLISWLQSPSPVIKKPKKIKSVTVFTFYSPICHEVMGPDTLILVFQMEARFAIASLPRNKHLLILLLESLSTVILEPEKIESVTVSIFPPSIGIYCLFHSVQDILGS